MIQEMQRTLSEQIIKPGLTIRHRETGVEAVVLEPYGIDFSEPGYEVYTLDDNVNRFVPETDFIEWRVVE